MSTPICILIADDHPVVREGLIAILSTQPDFEVVGEAGTGRDTVAQAGRLHPHVILLDLEMPEMDGLAALKQLRADNPAVRIIIFTAFDTDERILAAVRAGAQGYLLKGAPRAELFNAIRVVHAGGSLLQPLVASRLLQHLETEFLLRNSVSSSEPLTHREQEVLRLLAQGKPNKEIAATLIITERTVKFHVSSILSKLNASNRTEAVAAALQQGLIDL